MSKTPWVQFSWDVSQLPGTPPPLDKRYQVDRAAAPDVAALEAALVRSFSMEHGWSMEINERLAEVRQAISTIFSEKGVEFIVIKHGSRIIAASGITDQADAPRHFATGICVLNEYRCRGIGTFLLYESLQQLKAKGVAQPKAVTRLGITAEKFLYKKFGGVRSELTPTLVS